MAYNFQLAMSARISKEVTEEMVRRVVEEQTGRKVDRVEAKTNKLTRGIGPSEHTETVFDGFVVFFKNETTESSNAMQDKSGFVKATYQ